MARMPSPVQTPEIVSLPALRLVGFEARFISVLSPDANNHEVIPRLWDQLMARRNEIAIAADAPAYGACRCLPPGQRSREDEFLYLAGFPVEEGAAVPAKMVRWEIPARTYAQFTHRGPISRLGETIGFAWKTWLPHSQFISGGDVELERYDARFRGEAPESELDFLVPVAAKRR